MPGAAEDERDRVGHVDHAAPGRPERPLRPAARRRPARCAPRAPRVTSVRTLTLYGKPGCHLCDDARAAVRRATRRAARWCSRRSTSRSTRCCTAALRRAHSGAGAGRRGAVRVLRRRGRAANGGSIEWARELSGAHDGRGRGAGRRGRATVARRRGPPVALPPGPDPGEEDGPRDDLVAGAGGLHARQLDPDPPRPVRLRQVRQARRRLQRRLAGLADPQDPADHRQAQHRAVRRGQPGPGDRRVGHLRRPRLPRRGAVRQGPVEGRAAR